MNCFIPTSQTKLEPTTKIAIYVLHLLIFFVAKVAQLKTAIAAKLPSLTAAIFHDPPHVGNLLDSIAPVTEAEVYNILLSSPAKCSSMDFVPTSLVKGCARVFSELIAALANRSFAEGCFPACFKHAAITPLLKKPSLDKSVPSNYRPISNLNFSKILERLFLARIHSHILASPNFNQHQSAYRPRHSTETALLSTLNSIFLSSDSGKSTLLISLDLSAAFDTIDHSILLNRLENSFGLTGFPLAWIRSYITDRYQCVRIGRHASHSVRCTSGVPQGSVLGPLLFTVYTSPVANIASSYNIGQQQYADDTQLFIALSPKDYSADISSLSSCLCSLHSWFSLNGLALNPDKSDAILFGTSQRSHSYTSLISFDVAGSTVPLSDHVKILGVTLDSHLKMDHHVSNVCKSAYYHIRALRHIRSAITDDMAKSVACALVGARLDYASSVLYGVSKSNIHRLQRVQNALARVVNGSTFQPRLRAQSLLHQLHWLPVEWRIRHRLATVVFKTLYNSEPSYLHKLLKFYTPVRALRSSSADLLYVPRAKTAFGSRSFSIAAPTVWNSLPQDIRLCTSVATFRRHLKTAYFHQAFSSP